MVAKLLVHKLMAFFVAVCCVTQSYAQDYPVSGVWVAVDDHTPASTSGACFTLKVLGIDSVIDGLLPPVLIFSNGKRIEARAGYHSEELIKSTISTTENVFRISEVPAKRNKWLRWSKRQSHALKVIDPITLDFGNKRTSTRFVKCSGHLL